MKVFDLYCSHEHVFEAWFGSEDDFQSQMQRGLVECPLCGSRELRKGLSAPRLNLGKQAAPDASSSQAPPARDVQALKAMQAAWLAVSRQIAETTEDVGDQFAVRARRMHHGEETTKPIRGQATPAQAQALLEDGVPVLPLAPLLPSSKETLQ